MYKVETLMNAGYAVLDACEVYYSLGHDHKLDYKDYQIWTAQTDILSQMCDCIGADYDAVLAICKSCLRYAEKSGYSVDFTCAYSPRYKDAIRRTVKSEKPHYKSGREWDAVQYNGKPYYAYV